MVSQVINGLIASVVGAVAYIAVKALVGGSIYGPGSNYTYGGICNPDVCAANASNCSYYDQTAGELMIHDILPLAIAIMVIAGLFMGLTRIKGA